MDLKGKQKLALCKWDKSLGVVREDYLKKMVGVGLLRVGKMRMEGRCLDG